MLKLPKLVWVTESETIQEMGHPDYSAYYDPEPNTIYLNAKFPLRFTTLLHELVHWALCLLPRTDRVYETNLLYDMLWEDCKRLQQSFYTR